MDISFKCENQKFNYRVCAIIVSENKILAMHDSARHIFIFPAEELRWAKLLSKQ